MEFWDQLYYINLKSSSSLPTEMLYWYRFSQQAKAVLCSKILLNSKNFKIFRKQLHEKTNYHKFIIYKGTLKFRQALSHILKLNTPKG